MGDQEEPRRSASAESAALRRAESEPQEGAPRDEEDGGGSADRRRPSASAESAALRWRDEHADE